MENRIQGASILVTGANGGMGLKTVEQLANKGAERIVLACRTEAKALKALSMLKAGSTHLEPYGGFDMNSAEQIEEAVSRLPRQKFDIIFLQSGGMVVADDYQFIDNGNHKIERTSHQNAIGALLTLWHLEKADLIADNARIVFAGGEGARGIPGLIQKPDFESTEALLAHLQNAQSAYNPLNEIGVSKFISALIVQKLAALDTSRQYLWFSPGLTGGTQGLDALKNPKRFLMKHIGFPLMQAIGLAQGPEEAAAKYLSALNGDIGESGAIIGAPEGKALGKLVDQRPMNPALTNHQLIDGLWAFINDVYRPEVKENQLVSL